MDAPFSFNRSIGIGSRRDRITGDSGALTGRELLGRSGVVRFLAKGLPDKRDGRRIRHSQRRLARTLLLLAGQGTPGTQRRHGAAGRSGVAAGHRRPGGHGSAGQGRAPALAADAVAAGGCVVGEGGCPRCCARGCSGWRGAELGVEQEPRGETVKKAYRPYRNPGKFVTGRALRPVRSARFWRTAV